MEAIGNWLTQAVVTLNGWVWSPALVGLCLLAGLYFSLRTRFVQVRRFGEMFRLLFGVNKSTSQQVNKTTGKDSKSSRKVGISSFQAFAMALSGRVGTGNIVGVATAIGFGGPGAIVWMWIIAFFGAGSAFVEATLAQIYKENHNGQFRGGPAYYIELGLRSPFFGSLFAVLAAVACGVFLPPVQCNGIALSCSRSFGVPVWVIGLIVATLIALVIIGGVKRIANVAQIVAPVMALIYIILSLVVLAVHYQIVPDVFMQMLRGAVGVNEVGGALLGSTIAWGVKRGIYSNEAGQGTGPIVAAAAKVSHPVKQGLVQAFSVYIDTLLVCTATAMMILACKTYNLIDTVQQTPSGAVVTYLQQNPLAPAGEPGVFYTTGALGTVIGPRTGDMVISIALFFFAFTTIMAYYYYAETNLVYLFNRWRRRIYKKHPEKLDELERADEVFGDDRGEKVVVWLLRMGTISAVFVGSLVGSGIVWTLGDIGVGAMAWINVTAILLLSPKALRALRDYERQKRQGEEPRFNPQALGIEHADFWEQKNNDCQAPARQ
ncbi:MAG: alanine:cation symporter family protein [Bacteroidales bacterium]|nr:alanine:cation symporter family protein [Bacteroidales bacterium]